MSLQSLLHLIDELGFKYKEKPNSPGRFLVSKTDYSDVEVFELMGHAQIVYDPNGRYPAAISTEHWK